MEFPQKIGQNTKKIYKKKEKQKIKTAYGDFFLPKILKSDIGQEIKTKIRKKQKQKKMLKKTEVNVFAIGPNRPITHVSQCPTSLGAFWRISMIKSFYGELNMNAQRK